MADLTPDVSQASKQAQDSELVALKQQMDRLRGDITPGVSKTQKLRKACSDFEAVFISKMWEQMQNTIPKGGMFNSPQSEMYRSMFDRDFAEKLAGDGGMGLGDMLYKQLQDKIKNVVKTTKNADGTVKSGTDGEIVRTDLKAPKRPDAATQQAAQLPGQQADILSGMLQSVGSGAAGSAPSAAASAAASATAASSGLPASVSGEVMDEVEALAKRIENDFARRQSQASGYGATSGSASGRKLAIVG